VRWSFVEPDFSTGRSRRTWSRRCGPSPPANRGVVRCEEGSMQPGIYPPGAPRGELWT
jgi:hypothetical protein